MKRVRVGILGYDGVAAINVVGPLEAFSNAFSVDAGGQQASCYEVLIIACAGEQFVTDTGVTLQAHTWRPNDLPLDTIIIPGGRGMRTEAAVSQVASWIKSHHHDIRRIASVCTGVYGLAATNLLDGHRVTTHWQNAVDVANRFPKLQVEESALVVKDGKFYSAAGATAGIDLALSLIAEDFGLDIAVAVARKLLVYIQRDGGQEQYAEPLGWQARRQQCHGTRMDRLVRWMNKHLAEDLRLDSLAKRALLSKHDFIHEFTDTFGVPPGLFVKNLRFNEARRRLMSGACATAVARSVGFADPAYFIQEFRRRYGMLPSEYQRRFGSGESRQKEQDVRNQSTKDDLPVAERGRCHHQRPRITSFTRCIRRHIAGPQLASA
jgi:transcriptional regulator GlxA family with amidase domain